MNKDDLNNNQEDFRSRLSAEVERINEKRKKDVENLEKFGFKVKKEETKDDVIEKEQKEIEKLEDVKKEETTVQEEKEEQTQIIGVEDKEIEKVEDDKEEIKEEQTDEKVKEEEQEEQIKEDMEQEEVITDDKKEEEKIDIEDLLEIPKKEIGIEEEQKESEVEKEVKEEQEKEEVKEEFPLKEDKKIDRKKRKTKKQKEQGERRNRKIIIGMTLVILIGLFATVIRLGGSPVGFVVVSSESEEIEYLKATNYYIEFEKMVDNPVLERILLCSKDSVEIMCNKVKSKVDQDEWNDGYYWYARFSGLNTELQKTYLEMFVRSVDNKVEYFFYRDYFIGQN